MNWKYLRWFPGLDTRAGFVARVPQGGTLLDMGSSDGETLGSLPKWAMRKLATPLLWQSVPRVETKWNLSYRYFLNHHLYM